MSDKQTRMLDFLSQTPAWVTAGELADLLGVTPRTVRSYVTSLKLAAVPLEIIESGPAGYRLDLEAYAVYRASARALADETETPQDRLYALVRRLTESPEGLDVYALSAELFVSDSTIDADLTKVRQLLLPDAGLTLNRHGSVVTLTGSETDRRRLLSRLFREESSRGLLELEAIQREFASESLGAFKTDLIAMLDSQGYFVNEYGTNDVLLHVAIAIDRVTKRTSPVMADTIASVGVTDAMTLALSGLIVRHFHLELGTGDLDYIALLLKTRVITPGHDQPAQVLIESFVRPEDLDAVRRIVNQAGEEFLLDLAEENFIVRLTLHVRNLINRATERSYSHNPLTRSIKTSYPMIYEVAVYIASRLQRQEQIVINDDEIAYIAMHVGAHLQQQSRREDLVTCALICPNYYDMHVLLRERIERVLGDELEVVSVVTRSDVDWNALDAKLVLTTIEPQSPAEGVIVIQPFLTEADIDRIRKAASRIRRLRRRADLKDELLQFFDESLFAHNFHAADESAMIRALGERMIEHGDIDQSYIDGAIERELMSSTAFTDNVAVPHSMSMTAIRTSIAIVINDTPMAWGENRVNVVAMVAFSAAGRKSFQTVFDQFVEVFSDRADVQRLVKRSVDFASFIDELVHLMDQ